MLMELQGVIIFDGAFPLQQPANQSLFSDVNFKENFTCSVSDVRTDISFQIRIIDDSVLSYRDKITCIWTIFFPVISKSIDLLRGV